MREQLARIEPRTLRLALLGVLATLVLGGYFYGFKSELVEYDRLGRLHLQSEEELASRQGGASDARIETLQREVAELETRLYGKGLPQPPSQMVSHIIAQLDRLAVHHRVGLVSVKPGRRGEVLSFAEVPFDVEVTGSYFDLYAWLQDAESELRPMVVKQFRMSPGGRDRAVLMSLRVVSYRAPRFGG